MHNYLISSSANFFYTCKKSPAIDWLGTPDLENELRLMLYVERLLEARYEAYLERHHII